MRRLLLPNAALLLMGCALPGSVNVQSAVPVSKDTLAQVTTHVSDKSEVMKMFGSPASRTQSGNEEVWTYQSSSASTMMLGSVPKPQQAMIYFRDDTVARCVLSDPGAAPPEPPAQKGRRAAAALPNDCGRPVITPRQKRS